MPSSYQLQGFVYDRSGAAISSADVQLYKAGATTGSLSSTTTDANGKWTLNVSPAGSSVTDVDVEITNPTTGLRNRIKFEDMVMVERVYSRQFILSPDSNSSGSSKGFFTTLVATAAQGASHTITFPDVTGTVVVASQDSASSVTFSNGFALSSGTLTVGGDKATISSAGAITSTSTISAHGNITSSGDITGQTFTVGDSLAISSGGISVNGGTFTVDSAGDVTGQTFTVGDSMAISSGGLNINAGAFVISSSGEVTGTGIEGDLSASASSAKLSHAAAIKSYVDSAGGTSFVSAYKASATTRNSTSTLATDPDLTLSVSANTTYEFELYYIYNSEAAPDFKYQIVVPSGASVSAVVVARDASAVDLRFYNTGAVSSGQLAGTGGDVGVMLTGVLIIGGNAGSVDFDWAQNTSDTGDTTVQAGSWIRIREAS